MMLWKKLTAKRDSPQEPPFVAPEHTGIWPFPQLLNIQQNRPNIWHRFLLFHLTPPEMWQDSKLKFLALLTIMIIVQFLVFLGIYSAFDIMYGNSIVSY